MTFQLTFDIWLAMGAVLLIMALMPSLSVLLVTSRSSLFGVRHGLATAAGIVSADLLFTLVALFGLKWLADHFEPGFRLLTYLGGGYLIWLGVQLLRRPPEQKPVTQTTHATLSASFGLGLLFTLGDQKAILFYFGFFPAFIPMEQLETDDILLILFLTLVTVGGAKALYAVSAAQATVLVRPRRQDLIRRIAASVFLVIGVYLIITTTLEWR